jgi:hypothetical protein
VFESLPGEVYSIQHYVIKFVSDLQQVSGFLQALRFPPPIKLTATGVKFFFQKFTDPGPVSTRNLLVLKNVLLVLNIGMKEIKFVEHKIKILVTE